jgi:hypothetical protein
MYQRWRATPLKVVRFKVYVLVAICEFGAEVVGIAFDFSRPPSANVVDGDKYLFRSLVYR